MTLRPAVLATAFLTAVMLPAPLASAGDAVISPTVGVLPGCGAPGAELTVSGTFLDTGDLVTVTVGGVSVSTVAANGVVPGMWRVTVPGPAATGVYAVRTAVDPPTGPPYLLPDRSYQVPCPSLAASPRHLAARAGAVPVQLSAAGFTPSAEVAFTLDGLPLGTPAPLGADGTGSVSLPFPADRACGTYAVVAAEPPRTASVSITLTCPTLTVTPPIAEVGTQPAATTWAVTGFDPLARIDLRLDGVLLADGRTSRSGTASLPVPVDGAACGSHLATATQVVASPAPAPTALMSYEVTCFPGLTADVATVAQRDGDAPVAVSGTGFSPGSTVDFSSTPVGSPTTPAVVEHDGRVRATVPVPAEGTCGPLTMRAVERPILVPVPGPLPPATSFSPTTSARSATTTVTLTCPALDVTPGAVRPGDLPATTTWGVTGFDPDSRVRLIVDGTEVGTVATDAAGAATSAIPLDARSCGSHVALATEVGPGPAPRATTRVRTICDSAITVQPSWIAQRSGPLPVTVRGTDFDPGMPAIVELDGTPLPVAAVAGGDSTITVEVALPTSTPCGSHVISVRQETGPAATAPVEVTCPVLTVQPSTLHAGDGAQALPWQVHGFDPDAIIDLQLDGVSLGSLTVDSHGSGTLTVSPGRLPCGDVTATAVETTATQAKPTASTTVQVDCAIEVGDLPPGAPPRTDLPTQGPPASLVLSPAVVRDGEPVRAVGSAFTPGATVRLSWLLPDGSSAPGTGTAVVAADGTFTGSCLVFGHATLGTRELVAAEVRRGALAVSASVLIVAGSGQPGRHGLVTRR